MPSIGGATTDRMSDGPLHRFTNLLLKLIEGRGPVDTSGYYVTNSSWPRGVSKEIELSPEEISKELDNTFDNYYEAAIQSLARVDPDATETPAASRT